jgi:nitroreductase
MLTVPRPSSTPDALGSDWPAMASELIQARQTVLPKRLMAPAPDAAQQHAILSAAAAAPDHGQLLPWRFIEVPGAQRAALADVFAQALRERDASATDEQLEQAREKAHRSPWLLLLVVDALGGDAEVDVLERTLSAGCAVQNAMLMATALGFGSALTSGKALKSEALRALFALREGEQAICFLSIGTVQSRRKPRARPAVDQFFHTLGQTPAGD